MLLHPTCIIYTRYQVGASWLLPEKFPESSMPPKKTQPERRVAYVSIINPFSTTVPFWGQFTYNLSGLSPKQDCSPKRVLTRTWYEYSSGAAVRYRDRKWTQALSHPSPAACGQAYRYHLRSQQVVCKLKVVCVRYVPGVFCQAAGRFRFLRFGPKTQNDIRVPAGVFVARRHAWVSATLRGSLRFAL